MTRTTLLLASALGVLVSLPRFTRYSNYTKTLEHRDAVSISELIVHFARCTLLSTHVSTNERNYVHNGIILPNFTYLRAVITTFFCAASIRHVAHILLLLCCVQLGPQIFARRLVHYYCLFQTLPIWKASELYCDPAPRSRHLQVQTERKNWN